MSTRRDRRALSAFAFLLAIVWVNPPPRAVLQERKSADDRDPEAFRRLREADRRLVEATARELQKPESRPHDVRARAQLLEYDSSRIVEFVRKQIRFEAYPGLQRGSAGVLVSGAGNSADKALLLLELLRISGIEARMVRGRLSPEQARSLVKTGFDLAKARAGKKLSRPFGRGEPDVEKAESLCRDAGLSRAELSRLLQEIEHVRAAQWKTVLDLAAREAGFLQDQIRAAKLETPEVPMEDELVQATRNHFWVQWRNSPSDPWKDTDPCIESLAVGQAACPSEGEEDPQQIADRFFLSLSLDRTVGGKRERVEILRFDLPVHESLLRPLRFMVQPTGAKLPRAEDKPTEEQIVQQLAGYREFQAILMVGDEVFGSKVFDYDGKVYSVSSLGKKEVVAEAVAAAAKLFEGGAAAAAGKGVLESLWADLGVTRGGQPLWSQRRSILEEGQRASWCPMLTWNLFFQSHEFSVQFARYMRLNRQIRNFPKFQAFTDQAAGPGKKDWDAVLRMRSHSYPTDLLDFCLSRQAFVDSGAGDPRVLYFDRPNLFISGRQARIHGEPRSLCLCYGMDIVENGARVLQMTDRFALDPAASGRLGAFDTVLEQALVREANESEATIGTVGFFERARALGRPIRTVGCRDGKALVEAGVPKADAEWIQKNSPEGGFVITASLEPSHCGGTYAWWSVDPRRGQLLGRISGGRGGCFTLARLRNSAVEYSWLELFVDQLTCAMAVLIGAIHHGANAAYAGGAVCEVTLGLGFGAMALHWETAHFYMELIHVTMFLSEAQAAATPHH